MMQQPNNALTNAVMFSPSMLDGGWPDPEPIFNPDLARDPYPIDLLPPLVREAVKEYQRYGQQPVELVACSALASASLVCQGLANVARDNQLVGPCSLSFLVIAESGERKTGADRRLTKAIREWMAEQKTAQGAEAARVSAEQRAWEAEISGLEGKIKSAAGDESKVRPLVQRLQHLEQNPPPKLLLPSLFNEDVTQEALAYHLAEGWPTTSLWSDEGGLVVGSHGMSEDSVMRFLALLNRLWDGNPYERKRASAKSFEISGRRLTCSLMLQSVVMHQLLGVGGGAARGTGALARFFVAWPASTMGTRFYVAPDNDGPAMRTLDRRFHELLSMRLPTVGPNYELDPPVIPLSVEAQAEWVTLFNAIEEELSSEGDFFDAKDFASKSAENAARLACVLHVLEHGPHGEIDLSCFRSAAAVASWHLHEARRVLGSVSSSQSASDAQRLFDWMRERGGPVPLKDISSGLRLFRRDKKRREAAIKELCTASLIRSEKRDGHAVYLLNPKALEA